MITVLYLGLKRFSGFQVHILKRLQMNLCNVQDVLQNYPGAEGTSKHIAETRLGVNWRGECDELGDWD